MRTNINISANGTPLQEVSTDEQIAVFGGTANDGVVIVGCTQPFPHLKPGQIAWNPWIGQPYPTR